MGTYVAPLGPQNFIAKVGNPPVRASWLNAVDDMLQGNIPATGIYNATFVSGQVQVTGPNGYLISYGDLGYSLLSPGPLGTGPFLRVAGAGKTFGQIGTDAQIANQNGINLSVSAGDVAAGSTVAYAGGNLLLIGGGGSDGSGGTATLQGGTSANGNGGNTYVQGGNANAGIAGNLYLSGGLAGPAGGGSVHIIMTATGGAPGTVVVRANSLVLYTITQSGAIFIGASGAGTPGQILTSGGPNALPSWSPTTSGGLLYPQIPAEIVAPANFAYPVGDLRRYGAAGDGVTDDSMAWQAAITNGRAFLPAGISFRIVTPAIATGQVIVQGAGKTSKLLSDVTVLTVSSGTGSVIDNFWMENITPPWIITRDPTNWGANILGTLQQSNALGYQPTINDQDIWNSLTAAQQNQQIGPVIVFNGIATDIEVSRIYGRFVQIILLDAQYSTIRDCDYRGGKGIWGALQFDNATSGIVVGKGNKAIGNTIRYGSFSGIFASNNDGVLIEGNVSQLNGESGIKAGAGVGNLGVKFSIRSSIIGNNVSDNYYDGIDPVTSFPTNFTTPAYHLIVGNYCYRNGGDGINSDGLYNLIDNNQLVLNGRFGIWHSGASAKISNNYCFKNNVGNTASIADIVGGAANDVITDNYIISTGPYAIYAPAASCVTNNFAVGGTIFLGNPGQAIPALTADNVDSTINGLQTEQSFVLNLSNTGGTLQHATFAQSGAAQLGYFQSRILNASAAAVNTPNGVDNVTPLAAGWKIGFLAPANIWADTNDQLGVNFALLMATIAFNNTGTAITVRPQLAPTNINGVIRTRLTFQFFDLNGNAFNLNTANIPIGKTIQVQFYGKLA